MNWKELLGSKRFVTALVTVLAIIFKDQLPLPEEQLQSIVATIVALIIGDSLRPLSPTKAAQQAHNLRYYPKG